VVSIGYQLVNLAATKSSHLVTTNQSHQINLSGGHQLIDMVAIISSYLVENNQPI
jgi:hypothetical protein